MAESDLLSTSTLEENVEIPISTKIPASPEGIAIAYGSLVIMALLPIFFGAFRSVKHHREQRESGETPDIMSHRDAAMFPLIASAALFGLYIFFKVFSKEYINLLLTGYFFFLGVLALCHLLSPLISSLVPAAIPNISYRIRLGKLGGEANDAGEAGEEDLINYTFSTHDLVCLAVCSVVGGWYLMYKHWVANNLLGLAFAVNGVELLALNNVATGVTLLAGLFCYDVFWVFGTDVMVTVARSFEAPIKLVFPQDLLEKGLQADNFAMLGLGDIVIPGIFIALLLRFDSSRGNGKSRLYFATSFAAYILGLGATILVMHATKHAQPALLYLVPACVGATLGLGLVRGESKILFQYEDSPSTEVATPEGEGSQTTTKKDN